MIAGGNHTIIYMTPPYDGLLYKSKFDALTVEHNQDAICSFCIILNYSLYFLIFHGIVYTLL